MANWAIIIGLFNWLEEKQLKELEACECGQKINQKQLVSLFSAVKCLSLCLYPDTDFCYGLLTQIIVKN